VLFTRQRFVDLGPFRLKTPESRGKDVRLTVIGGIIATLVIKNRSVTYDVDFFTINNPKGEVKELLEISAEVGRALDMSPEWLNNATQLFLNSLVLFHPFLLLRYPVLYKVS
jgi:hypothetical protein